MDQAIGCEPGVWLAVTSVSFDISVLELLWTLTRGFTVVVHGDADSDTIADEIMRHRCHASANDPSLARMLTLDTRDLSALGSLKQMLLGGEAVPASLIHHLRREFTRRDLQYVRADRDHHLVHHLSRGRSRLARFQLASPSPTLKSICSTQN